MGALVLLGLAVAGCSTDSPPEGISGTVTVFAAASLTESFDAIAERFEAAHPGVDVVASYGGSSSLAAHLVEGAPADVFAAADEPTMQALVDAGDAARPVVFATNILELVVPAGNPGGVTALADLADPDLVVALCDPAVPCGSAAQALLAAAGVDASPDTLEGDVKAVLTRVSLGEADAGLVYVTDVVAAGDAVEGIEVPEAAEVVNRYPLAVLADAPNPAAAQAFVDFVLSAEGQRLLVDAGFVAP